jgi:hypothetical protein
VAKFRIGLAAWASALWHLQPYHAAICELCRMKCRRRVGFFSIANEFLTGFEATLLKERANLADVVQSCLRCSLAGDDRYVIRPLLHCLAHRAFENGEVIVRTRHAFF